MMSNADQRLKNIFKRSLIILNPIERKKLVLLSILDILFSLADILFLAGLLYLVSIYTNSSKSGNSIFTENRNGLFIAVCFLVLFTVKNWLAIILTKKQYHFIYRMALRLSVDGLKSYLNGSFTQYVETDSSVINRRISQQPIEFCHYVLNGFQQIFSLFILILITVAAIVWYNALLFPLLIFLLMPPIQLIAFVIKKRLTQSRLFTKKSGEKSIQHLQEALAGFVETNVNNKFDFFTGRYQRFQSALNHYLAERLFIQAIPSRMIEIFAVAGLVLMMVIHWITAQGGSISLITIGAFMIAAYKIIPGIVKISNAVSQVKSYGFATEGLAVSVTSATVPDPETIHRIAFKNIFHRYNDLSVLNHFSACLQKGDFVCLYGVSGKGKTSLINILLGFLQPAAGAVYINDSLAGQDQLQTLWPQISYAKQQSFFLNATLWENICLTEKIYNKEKLHQVIHISGLQDLIADWPEGVNTIITENGKNLSGGQRQRLIFARTLYKPANLVILDEPFNELDEYSEHAMLSHLREMADTGKIVLLITHNKKAGNYCTKILTLDESK